MGGLLDHVGMIPGTYFSKLHFFLLLFFLLLSLSLFTLFLFLSLSLFHHQSSFFSSFFFFLVGVGGGGVVVAFSSPDWLQLVYTRKGTLSCIVSMPDMVR